MQYVYNWVNDNCSPNGCTRYETELPLPLTVTLFKKNKDYFHIYRLHTRRKLGSLMTGHALQLGKNEEALLHY
jgi:hypothetical protein